MDEFLATALGAPTIVFTVFLGVAILYWVSVILGALDLDLFDPGGIDGVDGAADAADGALEAGGKAIEGGASGLAGVLSALRLRYAPLTVVLSVALVLGWIASYFGSRHLLPVLPIGGTLAAVLLGLASMLVALPLTSLLTRPLAPLFVTHVAKGNASLIGKIVTVKTSRVDGRFGQGELKDGQGRLLVHVRCEDPEALERGDEALIIGWDEERHTFEVEPLSEVLPERERKRRA